MKKNVKNNWAFNLREINLGYFSFIYEAITLFEKEKYPKIYEIRIYFIHGGNKPSKCLKSFFFLIPDEIRIKNIKWNGRKQKVQPKIVNKASRRFC